MTDFVEFCRLPNRLQKVILLFYHFDFSNPHVQYGDNNN